MKKHLRLLLLLFLLAWPVHAQTGPGNIQPSSPAIGNAQNAITTNGTGTAINVQNYGAAVFIVTITGTGTPVVTFKARSLSSASYTVRYGYLKTDSTRTLVSTTSTSGEYYVDCAGDYDAIGPVTGTWTGTVTVTIKGVPATARVGAPSGGGSTSLAIGTTAITGGTSGRVLIDVSGVVSEDAGLSKSGTGATFDLTVGRDVIATRQITGQFQTITPLSDLPSLTLRRFGSSQTNPILQWQTEANSLLGGVAPDGSVYAPKFGVDATHLNAVPSVNGDTFALLAASQAFTNKTINGNTFTTGTYTLTGTAAKTLNFLKSLTLDGTDGTTQTFPSTSATIARTDAAQDFTGNQSIGLGATASPTAFTVGDTSTSSPRGIMSWQSNTGTDGARLHLRKSRGTFASPTVVVTGDTLGKIVATGYDGSSFLEMASIAVNATGTIASTRVPTQIVFSTATNAAPSVLTTALTLGADQSATFAGSVLAGSGTTSSVGLGFAAGANYGFIRAGDGTFDFVGGGSIVANIGGGNGGDFTIAATGLFAASSSNSGTNVRTTRDAFLGRAGAANWRAGAAANATPVANILTIGESSRSGTDSNVAGASGTIQSGTGTGTGTVATLIFQTPTIAASGTTAQSYATRLTLDSTGVTLPGVIINTGITADTAHTDSTVCQDTTTHQFYSGTGTLGVCLGTSSARFKNSIHNLNEGLNEILALRPVNYFYDRTHGDGGRRLQYGFTAESTQNVLPVLVGLDSEGKPSSVDILGMFPVMVKAMQEMHAEIESLRAVIQSLDVNPTSHTHGRKSSQNAAAQLNHR